jgi:hypothetical protein
MKLLVFLHGTLTMHRNGEGKTPEERASQVRDNDESIHDWDSYIPIGSAVAKLKAWEAQGAEISYLSSRRIAEEVEKDQLVLDRYGFPQGPVFYRQAGESYSEIAERVLPDLLIEDDCECIGGAEQMTITHVRPEIKERIRSIIVPEFGGIDHLPDDLGKLLG